VGGWSGETHWAGLGGGTVGLIGHRADPEAGEENTSAGVRSAGSAPVVGVEIDVLALGEAAVVAHDPEALAAGYEPLADVLSVSSIPVMVDLKDEGSGRVVSAGTWPEPDRLLFVGNPDAVAMVGATLRGARLGLTWEQPTYPEEWLDEHGAEVLNFGFWCVRAELVERAHADGRLVTAWTVDRVDLARELARLGVDGIVTNVPRQLASGLDDVPLAPGGRGS
jgi:glycerophosphoryl diester phosphodiesterase